MSVSVAPLAQVDAIFEASESEYRGDRGDFMVQVVQTVELLAAQVMLRLGDDVTNSRANPRHAMY
jgi:hypothetical protein